MRAPKTKSSGRWAYSTVPQSDDTVEMVSMSDQNAEGVRARFCDLDGLGPPVTPNGSSKDFTLKSYDTDLCTASDSDEPAAAEQNTLRKVSDKLPWSAFLIAFVELCERFTYYGIAGPLQNYISNDYHDDNGLPGVLGLHQAGATALTNFFQFWSGVTPVIGAIIADQYLGKYLTIAYGSIVYFIGILILFLTSLPFAIEHGASLPGLVAAMIIIGLGAGGIKANVSPLIAEQYQVSGQRIEVRPSGERVIVDPGITISRIYMIFYLCINVGSLSAILTTFLEKFVGFWSAFLLCLIMFIIGYFVLLAGQQRYVVRPPQGSVVIHSFKALWIGARNHWRLDVAKPSWQDANGRRYRTPWDDTFIDELKRALIACKVFLFYPVYWTTFNQMMNNFVSQGKQPILCKQQSILMDLARQMHLHGIPNDLMQNLDPITIIIFIPICDRIVYPGLRRMGFKFLPITRIYWGFLLASLAMVWAAFTQYLIYSAPPCYDAPRNCDAARLPNGRIEANHIHVAVQTPAYILVALSEILASVTGLEYAFTKAPPSMKSFIMSMFLLTNAFGAALGLVIAPMAVDPRLVWMYSGLAIACFVAGWIFWIFFRRYNAMEDSVNDLTIGSHGESTAGLLPAQPRNVSASGSKVHEKSGVDSTRGSPIGSTA